MFVKGKQVLFFMRHLPLTIDFLILMEMPYNVLHNFTQTCYMFFCMSSLLKGKVKMTEEQCYTYRYDKVCGVLHPQLHKRFQIWLVVRSLGLVDFSQIHTLCLLKPEVEIQEN